LGEGWGEGVIFPFITSSSSWRASEVASNPPWTAMQLKPPVVSPVMKAIKIGLSIFHQSLKDFSPA
jgi:hypothetical protein